MKILFLTPYPFDTAPSQRFRFEQYFIYLKNNNINYDCQSFIDDETWEILYQQGFFLKKVSGIVRGFLRRMAMLTRLHRYDYVFVHREASPLGFPIFEFLIGKIFGKKIIFDYDDAIWLPNTSEQNKIAAFLKFHQKTSWICTWSYKVSVGNDFLGNYARQFNSRVVYNPTTIDTVNYHKLRKNQGTSKIVVGWTGTHSTLKYLEEILPIIEQLNQKYDFEFHVISNQAPQFSLPNLKFIKWRKEKEVEDLFELNIGVMPLTDDDWAKGKCGFKALQYMSLGIPAVVSPVGVNDKIVDDGVNGFVCHNTQEWYTKLEKLISDSALRIEMGKKAFDKIENSYSVRSNYENFLQLFS